MLLQRPSPILLQIGSGGDAAASPAVRHGERLVRLRLSLRGVRKLAARFFVAKAIDAIHVR